MTDEWRSENFMLSAGPRTEASIWHLAQSTKEKGKPKGMAKAKGMAKDKGKRQATKEKSKRKSQEPKHNDKLKKDAKKQDRKCFVCARFGHCTKNREHRVRTMNEMTNGTAPVLTPVSVITEPGHSLSHAYNHVQGMSGNHEWIPALTLDIHCCFQHMASNMKPVVETCST